MIDEESRAGRARLELKIYKRENMFHYRAARSGRGDHGRIRLHRRFSHWGGL
jgi:hypothetical protein